ncbi:tyrosine-type recombinase/integrase [Candidatus Similichlamydia epinepheli]|uniref:tyrosine-type recombinase/integrase n=1 Tax=Candidatus Similichlamydia epinepheli TaxID=1903953 RepID=UPI000D339A69|nr:tyrosine-type recombinase/integrase [Candidatus Similichlamydia epinepheli]
MFLSEALSLYLNFLALKGCSKETLRAYRSDLSQFFSCLEKQDSQKLGEVETIQIRRFIGSLTCSQRAICRKLSALRSFFRYLESTGKLDRNPICDLPSPKTPQRTLRFLEREQLKSIVSIPDVFTKQGLRDRVIFEVLYSSGLRVSELTNLSWEDIDLRRRVVCIIGKGAKERMVPLTFGAVAWLKRLQMSSQSIGYVFLNRFGKRISSRSIGRLVKKWAVKAGVSSSVHPHMIRHTIATRWMESGMDLRIIQSLLGHSTIRTTSLYTRVSLAFRREQMKRCHPLEIFKKVMEGDQDRVVRCPDKD